MEKRKCSEVYNSYDLPQSCYRETHIFLLFMYFHFLWILQFLHFYMQFKLVPILVSSRCCNYFPSDMAVWKISGEK